MSTGALEIEHKERIKNRDGLTYPIFGLFELGFTGVYCIKNHY